MIGQDTLQDKGFRRADPPRRDPDEGPGPGIRTGWLIRVEAGGKGQAVLAWETWKRRLPDTLHDTASGLYRRVGGGLESRDVPLPVMLVPHPSCDHPECQLIASLIVIASALHRGQDQDGHVMIDLAALEGSGGALAEDQMEPLF